MSRVMGDLGDKGHRRTPRRTGSGKAAQDHDAWDHLGVAADMPALPAVQYTDVGFADYQRFITHHLEDIAKRVEKMQMRICQMDITVEGLEMCNVEGGT
jgi:hypothetical protein